MLKPLEDRAESVGVQVLVLPTTVVFCRIVDHVASPCNVHGNAVYFWMRRALIGVRILSIVNIHLVQLN